MPRTPKECIMAVLANLEMAASACGAYAADTLSFKREQFMLHKAQAYRDVISLIRTECADILNNKE